MNVNGNIWACYCYKRLVSVSSRLVKPTSRSLLGLELLRFVPIPVYLFI